MNSRKPTLAIALLLACSGGDKDPVDTDSELVLPEAEEIRSWSHPCIARQNLRGTTADDVGSYYVTRIGPLEQGGDLVGAAVWLSEDFEDSGEDLCDPTLEVTVFAFLTDDLTPPEAPEFLFEVAGTASTDDTVDGDRWKLSVEAPQSTPVTAGQYVWVGLITNGQDEPFQFSCAAACGGDSNAADNDYVSGSDGAPFTWQDINESAAVDIYAAAHVR